MVGRVAVMTLALCLALGVSSLSSGQASTLGGLQSESLFGLNQAVTVSTPPTTTPPPPPLIALPCPIFTGTSSPATGLAGRPVGCGSQTWGVYSGSWTVGPDGLSASKGKSLATAPAGVQDVAVLASVLNAGRPNDAAGVVINHNPATGVFLTALLDGRGTVDLQLVVGGAATDLVSVPMTIPANTTIRLARSGSTVTVQVGGTALSYSYTLTPSQIATLTGGTGVGVYWAKGKDIRFTSIDVTTP